MLKRKMFSHIISPNNNHILYASLLFPLFESLTKKKQILKI